MLKTIKNHWNMILIDANINNTRKTTNIKQHKILLNRITIENLNS